jgi:hypothetical protein
MADFYFYLQVFVPSLWAIVSAGALLGVDEVARRYLPPAKRWLDAVPEPVRRLIELMLLCAAIFYAGFSAWDDEHSKRVQIEVELNQSRGAVVALQNAVPAVHQGVTEDSDKDNRNRMIPLGAIQYISSSTQTSFDGDSFSILVKLRNTATELLKYEAVLQGGISDTQQSGFIYPGQDVVLDAARVVRIRTKRPLGSVMVEPSFQPSTITIEYDINYDKADALSLGRHTHKRLQFHIPHGVYATDRGDRKQANIDASIDDETEK